MTDESTERTAPPKATYMPFKNLPREKIKRLIPSVLYKDEELLPQQLPDTGGKSGPAGRLEKVFPLIGGSFLFGFAAGGAYGIREGSTATRSIRGRIRMMQIFNHLLNRGKSWGIGLGMISLLYCTLGVLFQLTTAGKNVAGNSIAAGAVTGLMVGCSKGFRRAVVGGSVGIAVSLLHVLIDRN